MRGERKGAYAYAAAGAAARETYTGSTAVARQAPARVQESRSGARVSVRRGRRFVRGSGGGARASAAWDSFEVPGFGSVGPQPAWQTRSSCLSPYQQ